MNYSILLYWNSKLVLDGKATCAVTYNISSAHCVDQFCGTQVKQWHAEAFKLAHSVFSLSKIALLQKGEILSGGYEERTGHAQFIIERIA